MDESSPDLHALELLGLSLLSSAIPKIIKRRVPGLLHYSSTKRLEKDDKTTNNPQNPTTSLDSNSISSMGDHCHSDIAPEWSDGNIQRPATASSSASTDLDSIFSSNSSTRESFGMEVVRLEEPTFAGTPGYEIDSGVQWSRVLPALSLLRNAVYEAQQPQPDGQLVRSLYTGAIGYLLNALPADLNQEEAARIRGNLPNQLGTPGPQTGSSASSRSNGSITAADRPPRPYIHRISASIIIYFFILVKMIAPFIKSMAYGLYQYERSHRITERVATVTMGAARGFCRYGLNMGSAILRKNETPAGTAASLLIWWTENIAGGIYEGVGEGLSITGMDRSDLWIALADRLAAG